MVKIARLLTQVVTTALAVVGLSIQWIQEGNMSPWLGRSAILISHRTLLALQYANSNLESLHDGLLRRTSFHLKAIVAQGSALCHSH